MVGVIAAVAVLTPGRAVAHDPRMVEIFGLGGEADEADLAMYRGHALVRNGKCREALDEYTAAILLKPYLVSAYVSRAITYADLGMNNEALKDLNTAETLDSADYEVAINRAMVHAQIGQLDSAILSCDRAIFLDSTQAEALANRSSYRAQVGQLDSALTDSRAALALDSTYAPAWLSLTMVNLSLEDHDAAVAAFRKLLQYQTPEQKGIIEQLRYFVDTASASRRTP